MSLALIETLLLQLQAQVTANTAAISTLLQTLSSYATTDDMNALASSVNTLIQNNTTLQNAVATLDTSVRKIDNLKNLLDVSITSVNKGDVLQYGNDGKWHNIQPSLIFTTTNSGGTVSGSLSTLSDVYIAELRDGQVLTYSSADGKWINLTPTITV